MGPALCTQVTPQSSAVEFLGENAGCSERNHGKSADEHVYATLKHMSVDFTFMPWTNLYYQLVYVCYQCQKLGSSQLVNL